MDGGPQHPDRHSLGDARRRGVETAIRQGTRRPAAGPHSCAWHAHHGDFAATNAHHPDRFRGRFRSGRQRLRRELSAAGRQRHRLHEYGADDGRQVDGAAQGDCAARRPGRPPVQPGNGAICRILAEPVQNRRCVLRRAGESPRLFTTRPSSNPSLPPRRPSRMAA